MTAVLFFLSAAAAIGIILVITRHATLLFEANVQQGRIQHLRGRAPKRLVRDFHDVLRLRPVPTATLRVHSAGDHAELRVKGEITAAEVQRLRNVLGMYSVATIRSQPYRRQ